MKLDGTPGEETYRRVFFVGLSYRRDVWRRSHEEKNGETGVLETKHEKNGTGPKVRWLNARNNVLFVLSMVSLLDPKEDLQSMRVEVVCQGLPYTILEQGEVRISWIDHTIHCVTNVLCTILYYENMYELWYL